MIFEKLPVCFRVDLDDYEQPLKILISKHSEQGAFSVFLSTKHSEPDQTNADLMFQNSKKIIFTE
jgi:hypothetical protein